MKRSHLDEFVECYKAGNRGDRVESERFKAYTYEELIARDKVNLDLIWLKDVFFQDAANLPAPKSLPGDYRESRVRISGVHCNRGSTRNGKVLNSLPVASFSTDSGPINLLIINSTDGSITIVERRCTHFGTPIFAMVMNRC